MLELKDIGLKYSYKTVLKEINLSFEKGKIYSLLGENGAGKTSLARIICGDIKPSKGDLYINNKKVSFSSPKQAIEHGICCVHQRPLLSPSLSIIDNLRIGLKKFNKSYIEQLMQKYLPGISSSTLVKDLSPSQCFFTALISALLKRPEVLILDEPSDSIKQTLNNLAAEGLIVIIITHNLNEALEIGDEIILLKDGNVIQKTSSAEISEEDIKLKLYGIQSTIVKSDKIVTGIINEALIINARKNGLKKQIGYVPSDKTFRASNPNLTILQLLTALHPEGKQKELRQRAQQILSAAQVDIKLNEKCSNLSGGMLQRLILERELAEKPDTLFLFNPTHGLDIEAIQRLYTRLNTIAESGTNVIMEEKI